MKLRLFAATLAVMALGTTSIMAEGLQKTPDTPLSIVESQKDSASILPEQYKSYATKMNTVVKDYKNGYMFSIPWRVADGVMLDMDVRSESEHSPMPSTALSARFVQTIIRKKNPRRRKKIVTRFFCQSLAAISCGTRSALASARTKPT